jgi:hypothetical protein
MYRGHVTALVLQVLQHAGDRGSDTTQLADSASSSATAGSMLLSRLLLLLLVAPLPAAAAAAALVAYIPGRCWRLVIILQQAAARR